MSQQNNLPHNDPILAKRTRINRWVRIGLRVGYGLFGLAVLLFFVSIIADARSGLSPAIIVCLVVGSVVLAPAIVFSYAVKAANRADREDSW